MKINFFYKGLLVFPLIGLYGAKKFQNDEKKSGSFKTLNQSLFILLNFEREENIVGLGGGLMKKVIFLI